MLQVNHPIVIPGGLLNKVSIPEALLYSIVLSYPPQYLADSGEMEDFWFNCAARDFQELVGGNLRAENVMNRLVEKGLLEGSIVSVNGEVHIRCKLAG